MFQILYGFLVDSAGTERQLHADDSVLNLVRRAADQFS